MRKDSAPLVALAAASFASALMPDDVPLACIEMCSPVVELADICYVEDRSELRKLKRRKLLDGSHTTTITKSRTKQKKSKRSMDQGVSHDEPPHGPLKKDQGTAPVLEDDLQARDHIREFMTIPFSTTTTQQPARPTNMPVGDTSDQQPAMPGGGMNHEKQSQQLGPSSTTTPKQENPATKAPAMPPTSTSSPTPSTTISDLPTSILPGGGGGPDGNFPIGDGDAVGDGGSGGGGATDPDDGEAADGDEDEDDAEEDERDAEDGSAALPEQEENQASEVDEPIRECFCENNSFDVPRIAGLCADCIWQMKDRRSPIENILDMCNFTADEAYDPSKESAVANVQVEATKPGSWAGFSLNDRSRTSALVAIAAAGFAYTVATII